MDFLNREPLPRKIKDSVSDQLSEIRNRPGNRIRDRAPDLEKRNIGDGKVAGSVGAAVVTVLEDVVGVPFGASVDVVDVRPTQGGQIYTVNVNAPSQNMAEARAFIDSGTGFTSYLTEEFDVENVHVLNKRVIRDTFQIELRVR